MWFLRDESGEKVSEFFPSQAKLAVHMQMTPQTLQRAIKKGKNVFQFHGQEVRVVQETIPQFAVFDFPPSENPIETFEWVSEVAKWLKVPNQTLYAAVKRGDETKVKNKEGVFWLKKLEVESVFPQPPVPLPRKKVPPVPLSPPEPRVPPVPLPRRKVPLPQPLSPPTPLPTPQEVVEIVNGGQKFSFNPKEQFEITIFHSAAKLAKFIKYGLGQMFLQGAKKHQMFICNEKRVFLPDLVREIIVFHIRDQMWKDEDGAEGFVEKVMEYNWRQKEIKNWINVGFSAKVRKLHEEAIDQICKEFMKMF